MALKWFALDFSPFVNKCLVISRTKNIFEIEENLKIDPKGLLILICSQMKQSMNYQFGIDEI